MSQERTRLPRRKIISNEDVCMIELEKELPLFFRLFEEAVSLFEKEIVLTPPTARARSLEATLLNSKIIQCVQQFFPDNWRFGKYKRFILRLKGYIVLFKKLNGKNMPMNIKTKSSDAIANQLQYPMFEEFDDAIEPIVFFGYRKDSIGNILDPKLVYIDENKLRWTITRDKVKGDSALVNMPKIETENPIIIRKSAKKNRTSEAV